VKERGNGGDEVHRGEIVLKRDAVLACEESAENE